MTARATYLVVLPWDVLPWDPRSAGGVNEVVRNLLRCVGRDATWRPALLVSSWDDRRVRQVPDAPVLSFRGQLREPFDRGAAPVAWLKSLVATPLSLAQLARILVRERVEVVNLHYPMTHVWSFVLLRRLLRRRRFRLVLSFHGQDVEALRRAEGAARRAWARALRESDALVCCSRALAEKLVELEPDAAPHVAVVHNGIDPEETAAELRGASLPEAFVGRRYVACVATYERKKGLDVLVHAFARIARDEPDTDLVLVGREDSEHAALRAVVAQLGLEKRVRLLGDLPHPVVMRIVESARLLVLPSRDEPFGLVLLEAGLLGVPIVATRVGGIPEVVVDGETGRLVPPDDPQALADAMRRALREDAESRRLAAAMRDRVRRDFSWDAAFARYRELARAGRPGAAEAR